MATQLWVPKPKPSPWDRFKCFLGFHDFESPEKLENADKDFYCKRECGSFIGWRNGLPKFCFFKLFRKFHVMEIKVTMEEKK